MQTRTEFYSEILNFTFQSFTCNSGAEYKTLKFEKDALKDELNNQFYACLTLLHFDNATILNWLFFWFPVTSYSKIGKRWVQHCPT
jgi:hypothetical protein